jgi:hypothetical protein
MFLDVPEIVRATRLIEATHGTKADWGRIHLWLVERYLRTGRKGAAAGQLLMAAAKGQLAGAASSLVRILRRRLGYAPERDFGNTFPGDAWSAMVAAWLRDCEDCLQ